MNKNRAFYLFLIFFSLNLDCPLINSLQVQEKFRTHTVLLSNHTVAKIFVDRHKLTDSVTNWVVYSEDCNLRATCLTEEELELKIVTFSVILSQGSINKNCK